MYTLHKQNLYECVSRMAGLPGWEILEDGELLALKSPARFPLVDCVWGDPHGDSVEAVGGFFGPKPFSWLLSEGQDPQSLLHAGFQDTDATPEMVADLAGLACPPPPAGIEVIQPRSPQELSHWAAITAESLALPEGATRDFFLPLLQEGVLQGFLALAQGEPAAASSVHFGQDTAGIYTVGTRKAFRGKGAGKAVTRACLQAALERGMDHAVLFASEEGRPMYERLGFRTRLVYKELVSNGGAPQASSPNCSLTSRA